MFENPSDYVVLAGFIVIALLTWWGIRKTDPKLAPRIREERAEDFDIAGGGWRRYRDRDFVADHPGRERVGL
jgi:hypothetical protein